MADFDFVILGGGAAGFAAAVQASKAGALTALVERSKLGGTCVNVGCVPSKHLIAAAEAYHRARHSPFAAISGETWLDVQALVGQKEAVVAALQRRKYEDVLSGLQGVELLRGDAAFVSREAVSVGGRRIEARRFLIATGSSPSVPDVPGLRDAGYLTNVEALQPEAIPEALLVIGGRALGLEFAQLYARLGSSVTLLQRSSRILPDEEPEISAALTRYLTEEGVEIVTGAVPARVDVHGGKRVVRASIEGQESAFEADVLLAATGRHPNTAGLGLDQAGVATGPDGEVLVDERMKTTAEHVFAAGDVTGPPMLETAAARQGFVAAVNALTPRQMSWDFTAVPHAVFTDPQVASVGLTEARMMRKLGVCACRTLPMEAVPKANVVGDTRGLVKMVIHPETRKILGVHMLSPLAADVIHEAVLAVKFGLTVDDILDTVHVFPTHSEALKLAALSFTEDVGRLPCCAL